MRGLRDKRVLVTGGASGIGAATAARFLVEEAKVVVLDNDVEALERIHEEQPRLTATLLADVSDSQSVMRAFKELDSIYGGLDVLINNAGISMRHPSFVELDADDWQRVMDVNLRGVFLVAQQAARRMLAGQGGVILNMGSTNALVGYRHYFDYDASKAGVVELTRSMALELAPTIRVNAVCPGYVLTPMQEVEYTPAMMQELNDKIPLKRHAKPEEVAALFAFLASDDAAYLTGQCYVIDGGETAGGLASR
jgi:NAD(P)-dependent dehydrogenase (short-subunit alcohol dehydrogenase family)